MSTSSTGAEAGEWPSDLIHLFLHVKYLSSRSVCFYFYRDTSCFFFLSFLHVKYLPSRPVFFCRRDGNEGYKIANKSKTRFKLRIRVGWLKIKGK